MGRGTDEDAHRSGTVSLVGRTNVGKSLLANRLVGEKFSIVADVPQTTRHRILGVRTEPGCQIAFVDTPGFHRPKHRMNRLMVAAAQTAIRDVDLVLFVIDVAGGVGSGDRSLAKRLTDGDGLPPVVVVLNKVDLVRRETLLPLLDGLSREWSFSEFVPVSALTGENCDRLLDVIRGALPEGPPLYPPDTLTDQPGRLLAMELVREKILHHTRQELPHETAVVIERWNERDDGLVEIDATILCEKESQKGILIGKEGGLLKRIGSEARPEVERIAGARVMLRMWVRVRRGWRESTSVLREMGITGEP